MNLDETVTYCGLEMVFLCRSLLCRLSVPIASGGGAGFDVDTSQVFDHSALVAITLVVSGAGDGVARANAELGLPFCSVAISTLSGARSVPITGAEALRVRLKVALSHLSVCFSLFLHWEGSANASGTCVHTEV